jgi:hypothetical protein
VLDWALAVAPGAMACLAATAAQALLGDEALPVLATRHPSAILRIRDEGERSAAFDVLVRHLRLAWRAAAGHADR